jgi:RHS repeat-associated protein
VLDNNKGIGTMHYNYLNLQDSIVMTGKGYIKYVFDATGSRLQKTTIDSVANKATITTYIGGFVYQRTTTPPLGGGGTDTLQFVSHAEGRARWAFHKYTTGATAYKFEYDFFEKDHLGNTRTVLTQQKDTANYLASMEAAYRTTESQLFANIAASCYSRSLISGYPTDNTTVPNDSVARLNGSGQKSGPSLLLKVMSGDVLQMAVKSFYKTGTNSAQTSSFSDILNSLANGIVTTTGGAHGTVSNLTQSGSTVYTGLNSFITNSDPNTGTSYPKAYLNWIFLDDQFNYVSALSGAIPAASSTYPAGTLNTVAPGSALNINKNGYLYIWVSNETQNWDVFFDNLSVQHRQGPLLEESHYYPFGLAMQGISDKALKTQYAENKLKYNGGSELQNKEFSDGSGLELYETSFRSYDPQLGRFWQTDPLADIYSSLSPYQFAGNDPIAHNDVTGAIIGHSEDAQAKIMAAYDGAGMGSNGGVNLPTGSYGTMMADVGGMGDIPDDSGFSPGSSTITNVIGNLLNSPDEVSTWANTGGSGTYSGYATSEDLFADVMQKTWAGSATDISAAPALTLDGYNINYNLASNGEARSTFYSNDEIAGLVQTYLNTLSGDDEGDASGIYSDITGNEGGNEKPTLPDMKQYPPDTWVPQYVPPKSGTRKVRNPNGRGSGWIDKKGDVWVPDDHNGTHAPHWDVQWPNGDYHTVYPAVQTATIATIGVAILWGIWEGVKYTTAIGGAPFTEGASLGLLALP